MSYLEVNRLYRVTPATGDTLVGYIERDHLGAVYVFSDCVRVITASLGPQSYAGTPPTNTYLQAVHLLAVVQGPLMIEPLGLTPVEQLPYGAVHEGTWYHRIQVPYVQIPANRFAAQ